jgi:hypothetical protein
MTGNMPDRRCGTCRHYTAKHDRCHRHPPTVVHGSPGRWPIVTPTDTCGEWDTWRLAPEPEPAPEPKYGAATADMLDIAMQNGRLNERGDVVAWLTEAQFHSVAQDEVAVILRLREQFRRGMHERRKP